MIDENDDDEWRARLLVVPGVLLGAWFAAHSDVLRFLMLLFAGMPVHEVGHAVTSWLCSIPAMPALWVTPSAAGPSFFFGVVVLAGLGFLVWRTWLARAYFWCSWCAIAVVLFFRGTTAGIAQAHMWIDFWGDGGAMLLGALLMCTFVAAPGSALRRGHLRWGLVVLGAVAWAVAAEVWLSARVDPSRILYGSQEYAGPSDPTRLVDRHGWTEAKMVSRYVLTAFATLTLVLVRWAYGLWELSDDDQTGAAG